jgi:hypothetical protein
MASVKLTPMGNKIKYKIRGDVKCNRGGYETLLRNSMTLPQQDLIWLNVFGSKQKVKAFLKDNRVKRINIPLLKLGYDNCDHVI